MELNPTKQGLGTGLQSVWRNKQATWLSRSLNDEAASKVRLRSYTAPPNLKELEQKLEETRKEKDAAVQSQEFEKDPLLKLLYMIKLLS